jgi:hypothetical protein
LTCFLPISTGGLFKKLFKDALGLRTNGGAPPVENLNPFFSWGWRQKRAILRSLDCVLTVALGLREIGSAPPCGKLKSFIFLGLASKKGHFGPV